MIHGDLVMANVTRVPIPLKKETRRKFQALADVQSSSLASVCSEILDACADEVYDLAKALELAKKSPAGAKRKMAAALEQRMAEADQMMLKLEPQPKVVAGKKKTGS